MSANFRAQVAGIAALKPVLIRGQEYTGAYLATLVAVNPEHGAAEAARTPQLISELGRLVAAALRDKEIAEARYRAWRDSTIHELTTDLDAARGAGFDCTPGKYANGKDKPATPPSRAEAETYLHTMPEYVDRRDAQLQAEEAWATVYATYEAAKARQWAIRDFRASGDQAAPPQELSRDVPVTRDTDDGTVVRHMGSAPEERESLDALEHRYQTSERSPIPPRPATIGPPPGRGQAATGKRPPPPPPKR